MHAHVFPERSFVVALLVANGALQFIGVGVQFGSLRVGVSVVQRGAGSPRPRLSGQRGPGRVSRGGGRLLLEVHTRFRLVALQVPNLVHDEEVALERGLRHEAHAALHALQRVLLHRLVLRDVRLEGVALGAREVALGAGELLVSVEAQPLHLLRPSRRAVVTVFTRVSQILQRTVVRYLGEVDLVSRKFVNTLDVAFQQCSFLVTFVNVLLQAQPTGVGVICIFALMDCLK